MQLPPLNSLRVAWSNSVHNAMSSARRRARQWINSPMNAECSSEETCVANFMNVHEPTNSGSNSHYCCAQATCGAWASVQRIDVLLFARMLRCPPGTNGVHKVWDVGCERARILTLVQTCAVVIAARSGGGAVGKLRAVPCDRTGPARLSSP